MTPTQEFYERTREPADPNLPSNVRERIERREVIREGGNGKSFALGAMIVLLLVAVGGFLWWNSRQQSASGLTLNPAGATQGTADAYGTEGAAGSVTTNDGTTPMEESATSFGIGIGAFDDEASAQAERARLNSLTDQPVSVATIMSGGGTQYQVILGSFATRAAADSMGRTLTSHTSVGGWKVVPIH